MTDNYRKVNVYRDSQPYSGRKIAIMMQIMLSDIVIGDVVALSLSLTVGVDVVVDCHRPGVEGFTAGGIRLLGQIFGQKICFKRTVR